MDRNSRRAAVGISVVFLLLSCLFAGVVISEGRAFCTVEPDLSYSFVLRSCSKEVSAAVVKEVYRAGGAGYATEDGVIVACYFETSEAERAASMLRERGTEAEVKTRSVPAFVLEGRNREEGEAVLSTLSAADSCARVLFDVANGLERMTVGQEEARAAVRGVGMSLRALSKEGPSLWGGEMTSVARDTDDVAAGILFAKDVRLLQVRLCLAVLSAKRFFG